jgi:hypothetical protein
MPSLLKRKFLVALICALPAVLGVESATGHSGAGSSSAGGSSSGHGGSSSAGGSSSGHGGSSSGHGGGHSWTAPSDGHSSTGLNSAHMSGASQGSHSSTGLNSAHMSGASRGGHFARDPVTDPPATGGARSGRFIRTDAIRTSPVQSAKQRQVATGIGYMPSNLQENDELWRKRHHYHRFSSP